MATLKQISVINFIVTIIFFLGTNVCKAQKTDTVYVLYEDSDISYQGPFGKTNHFDSLAAYPYDKGRWYEFTVEGKPISFTYLNQKTEDLDCTIEVKQKNVAFLRPSNIKGLDWFKNSSYSEIVAELSKNNRIIYLAEKQLMDEGLGLFIKVCVHYQVKE